MLASGSRRRLGVVASIASSLMFVVVFVTSAFLDFTGNELFGWRIAFSALLLVGFLTFARRWRGVAVLLRRIRDRPVIGLALLVTAAILGAQQWLFTWAPGQGRGLPVALGYFILPIVLALVGRIVFRERLGPWRTAAVIVAGAAVTYQLWLVGGLSWETLLVAGTYPIYFAVRRLAGITGSAGLTAEMVLILPASTILLAFDDPTASTLRDPQSLLEATLFGIFASLALLFYIAASQLLPMVVFGLLSYLEPVLIALAAALVLREPFAPAEWPTYIAIGVALVLLALEGIRRPHPPRAEAPPS
ncbi:MULTISPECIES: EamA family transporter RarD [unclassified Cryobacterium]|uniref:EamA family transporter RarD n=1 Tax=unclassified Cryobacterium TaxID=2649013 RepID=UPI0014459452